MNFKVATTPLVVLALVALLQSGSAQNQSLGETAMFITQNQLNRTIEALVDSFGVTNRTRISKGVRQAAERWRSEDGDFPEFLKFCKNNFLAGPDDLDRLFTRYQQHLEALNGNLHRIERDFQWPLQVDVGPVIQADYLFANYDPYAHTGDDLFKTKIAFAALLNFPLESLATKSNEGMNWPRVQWAKVRLAEDFSNRVPATVEQQRSQALVAADDYISNYNIYMHNLLDQNGNRLFPEGLKLISHWGLRDELKAQYANQDGLSRQKVIQKVMERIIRQEIPAAVIDNPKVEWNPWTNEIKMTANGKMTPGTPESNVRYQKLLNIFQAEKQVDKYRPDEPSLIDRRFNLDREMSESEVEGELKRVLTAPVLKDIAALIQKRLGRPLMPFDIWYAGFKPQTNLKEADLDRMVSQRYPNVKAFQQDLPDILEKIGFSNEKAQYLAAHINVDPSRGAGHAMGAEMRSDNAHLRTRIPESGMNYKGFNIAIHELGHNVEQVFSLNEVDYYTLNGVPNTAFTEAFAFVFQSRDLKVLGVTTAGQNADNLRAVNDLWAAYEISGVALTDMYIWRWLYAHPEATAPELKSAVVQIAQSVWNQYFAPILGMKDQVLLAVYSHIIDADLYTPDYPLGHIISFQIEQYLQSHELATEMERMCRLGRLSPQVWMQKAVGAKVSAQPLIDAAEKGIKEL